MIYFKSLKENHFRTKWQISLKKFMFRRFRIRENMWWTHYRLLTITDLSSFRTTQCTLESFSAKLMAPFWTVWSNIKFTKPFRFTTTRYVFCNFLFCTIFCKNEWHLWSETYKTKTRKLLKWVSRTVAQANNHTPKI